MKISFLERTRIERSTIKLINSNCAIKLHGLSKKSIEQWSEIAIRTAEPRQVANVTELLLEISRRLQSNSDASKHVFQDGVFSKNSTTEACMDRLEELAPTLK